MATDPLDPSRPSRARVYDCLLGGKDNYEVDREAARKVAEKAPEIWKAARQNRCFLVRAVRVLAEAGVRQFIDLGSGFPTSPNVHEVARQVHPDAKAVYVDNDPVVAAHDRALNAADKTAVVQADLREPDMILLDPVLQDLIDFTQPVAALFIAVLHFLDDRDSRRAVARFHEAMAPGSYLAISHVSPGTRTATIAPRGEVAKLDEAIRLYRRLVGDIHVRTPEQVAAYFDSLKLVEPGLVEVNRWRPKLVDPGLRLPAPEGLPRAPKKDDPRAVILAGVSRVP